MTTFQLVCLAVACLSAGILIGWRTQAWDIASPALVLTLAAMVLPLAIVSLSGMSPRHPRLVGYGCEGSSGPLYANEEDHLPRCERIERN